MFRFHTETPDDEYEVEYLFDLCFAPGRTALSSYRLRDGVAPLTSLSWVARDEYNALLGAIRFWPIRVASAPVLLLGPIAVHPVAQGEGLGAQLMSHSLEVAAAAGWRAVLLVGDLPYYRRFGFEQVPVDFPPPTNPDRVLGRALKEGGLDLLSGAAERWTG